MIECIICGRPLEDGTNHTRAEIDGEPCKVTALAPSVDEPEPDSGIIPFQTSQERSAKRDASYTDRAAAEAITMLEEALAYARGRPEGQRVTAVAISLSFEDRAYGRHIPLHGDNLGSLLAALSDAHYGLLKLTNGD